MQRRLPQFLPATFFKAAGFMRCPHVGRHTLKGLLSNYSNYLATLIVYPIADKMSIELRTDRLADVGQRASARN